MKSTDIMEGRAGSGRAAHGKENPHSSYATGLAAGPACLV